MLSEKKLKENIQRWAESHRANSRSIAPFHKYSDLNLAYANQALRGNRGKLFIVDSKLYNSQSGRVIPTRSALERDFFGWLFTNNQNDINAIKNDLRSTEINRYSSKKYTGNYDYKDYNGANQKSELKLSKSMLNRILRK